MITEKISLDLNTSLKEGNKEKVSVLRMVKAALINEEINKRHPLSNEEAYIILEKLQKQRRDAFLLYEKGNRPELASKEKYEMTLIESYLPKKMSEEEVKNEVVKVIKESKDKDFGIIMSKLMPLLKGKADGALISKLVKEELR